MDKVDYLEKEHQRLLNWIQAADSRIAIILPLGLAMLGTLAAVAKETHSWDNLQLLAAGASFILLSASLTFLAVAAFPRTDGAKSSIVFFGGINSLGLKGYQAELRSSTEDSYIRDLTRECFANARIASIKFKFVRLSLIMLFSAALPWMLAIFLLNGSA